MAPHRQPPGEPDDRQPTAGLRTGFTTGACAAAAARAAARCLVTGETPAAIEITLPNGQPARFALSRCEREGARVRCGVVKDAGDDPDCTHGAEIVAEVELRQEPGVELRSGPGVATVTRPGLGLEIGAPAINPVPRRNIGEMVLAELAGSPRPGAVVTVSVPRGEEIARATLNARLGLMGGISILGTTGIVRPFSTAAWQATITAAIDVARAQGLEHLVFTTGGRSERFAMALLPQLPEMAFVQVGDDVGLGLRHASGQGARRITVVAMVGKLAKMAAGAVQTHVSRSQVETEQLAILAARCGAKARLQEAIRRANTARHALELTDQAGLQGFPECLCQRAAESLAGEAGPGLRIRAVLIGFDGAVRAAHPALAEEP